MRYASGRRCASQGDGRASARYLASPETESAMITEIAQIDVKPGLETEFEAGVAQAMPVFRRAKGCGGLRLEKSIEKPSRYRLFVQWETVENPTVDFRGSADFQEWRKCVGHCFESLPTVEHTTEVYKGF
jgi:heme-degrading monooxygenase HmoA